MIAYDKKLHLLAGLAISILGELFIILVPVLPFGIVLFSGFGLLLSIIAGALKEIVWDWWLGRGTPDIWDFWYTVLGGFWGYFIMLII